MNELERYDEVLDEQYFRFVGITSKKKKDRVKKILKLCKEIRDTSYPMKNSDTTELEIAEFIARKESDLIYINGSLSLNDGIQNENRCFEAYIIEESSEKSLEKNIRIYLDITRLCVDEEPKMIRTTDEIIETDDTYIIRTKYSTSEINDEKEFICETSKTKGRSR